MYSYKNRNSSRPKDLVSSITKLEQEKRYQDNHGMFRGSSGHPIPTKGEQDNAGDLGNTKKHAELMETRGMEDK